MIAKAFAHFDQQNTLGDDIIYQTSENRKKHITFLWYGEQTTLNFSTNV